MGKIEISVQSGRTLAGMRGTVGQEDFLQGALAKTRGILNEAAGVPFLAFRNLSASLVAGDDAFLEAGYAVENPFTPPDGFFCVTLPAERVLNFVAYGEPESRSAIFAEFAAYAKILNLKLKNSVYEYYFIQPDLSDSEEVQKITVFSVPVDDGI